jgi:cell division transport system permease protein
MDLEVNPLPQSLEVELRPGARNPDIVRKVSDAALLHPFVEDARYGREWVDRLFTLRRIGAASTAVLGTAFALVAALIIGTALRIAIFARRDEIYIMRLVGAKNSFIRRPFLLEGAFAGFFGGLFALALTYSTYRGVYGYLFEIAWVPPAWVAIGLLGGGAFGALSSAVAIRRHLREV